MELELQKRGRRLCDSCAQVSSEFLEMALSTAGGTRPKPILASPTFKVNISTDFVTECPLCQLLRACISPRLLDPPCMEVQLCLKTPDPYLVAIEYSGRGLYGSHRGDLCLLSDPGMLRLSVHSSSRLSRRTSPLTESQRRRSAKSSVAEESAIQAPKPP